MAGRRMTAAKQRQQQSGPDPASGPHGASGPPGLQPEQHSWVLQTTMDLQKSVGELTGTVNGLVSTVDGLGQKVDELAKKVNEMHGGIGVARWFVGTLIGIGGLIGVLLWRLPAIIEALRTGS